MLRLRLLTAAVGIPLLAIVLWLGHPWLGVLLAIVALLAAVEIGELLERAGFRPAHGLVALLAVSAVALAAATTLNNDQLVVGWLVLLVVGSLAAGVWRAAEESAVRSWLATVAGASYVAMVAFLLLIAVGMRPDAANGPLAELLDAGRAWLLVVVLGVWAHDSAAYAVGRLWGRGRFFNHISPNKTWSGAIGGSIAAIAAGAALGALVDRPVEGAGLGVLIGIGAPVGDLAESALKRAAQVKDSGRLFPGHGGMLDRIDAFLVVAPLAWLYLAVIGLA